MEMTLGLSPPCSVAYIQQCPAAAAWSYRKPGISRCSWLHFHFQFFRDHSPDSLTRLFFHASQVPYPIHLEFYVQLYNANSPTVVGTSYSLWIVLLPWQSLVVARETIWLAKPKILIIQHFTGQVWQPVYGLWVPFGQNYLSSQQLRCLTWFSPQTRHSVNAG